LEMRCQQNYAAWPQWPLITDHWIIYFLSPPPPESERCCPIPLVVYAHGWNAGMYLLHGRCRHCIA
jgi:hypothetical protein